MCGVRRICSYSSNRVQVVLVLDFALLDYLLFYELKIKESANVLFVRQICFSTVRLFGACDLVVSRCLHHERKLTASIRDGPDSGRRGDARLGIDGRQGNCR